MRGSYSFTNPAKKPLKINQLNNKISRDIQPLIIDHQESHITNKEEKKSGQNIQKDFEEKEGSNHLLPSIDFDKENKQNRALKRSLSKAQPYRIRDVSQSQYGSKTRTKTQTKRPVNNQKMLNNPKGSSQCREKNQKIYWMITDFIDKLNSNFYLSIKSGVISIKRNKFQYIFKQLVDYMSFDSRTNNLTQDSTLHPFFAQLSQLIKKTQLSLKVLKSSYHDKFISLTIDPADYHAKKNTLSMNLVSLQTQKAELQKDISNFKKQERRIKESCSSAKAELGDLTQKLDTLKKSTAAETKIYESTLSLIIQGQTRLNKIEEETQKIVNFVTVQQDMPVLHAVSVSYKQIEQQIYSYAAQLQHNDLYCSLTFEPKPFSVVEGYIKDDMQRLLSFITAKDKDFQQKIKRTKDFVLSSMRKFKNKDEEMGKVSKLKTQCCLKFISMMQKLMENWQLKQDFLVNLRKQFVVNADSINSIFKKLIPEGDSSVVGWRDCEVLIRQLNKEWKSVQQNYKLGNSFY